MGRPTHSTSNVTRTYTGADDAPVPAVGHALHAARRITSTSTTSTVTTDSRPPHLHLPPPTPPPPPHEGEKGHRLVGERTLGPNGR